MLESDRLEWGGDIRQPDGGRRDHGYAAVILVEDVIGPRARPNRASPLQHLPSYICDRRQMILFDGAFSTVRSLSCGVPQGSVLGPLLFLLYTAYLGELAASLDLSSHFYADDSQLYTWGPPSTVAQQWRRTELGIERKA